MNIINLSYIIIENYTEITCSFGIECFVRHTSSVKCLFERSRAFNLINTYICSLYIKGAFIIILRAVQEQNV